MPRRIPWPPPIYQRQGKDVVRLRMGPGRYREVTLGPAGSDEARSEYARILAEVQANGCALDSNHDITVAELVVAYLQQAAQEQEPRSLRRTRRALAGLVQLYGRTQAVQFGPLALKTVRNRWESEDPPISRQYVNHLVQVVRAAFRWAAEAELIPATRAEVLSVVRGLRRGKTPAPEAPRVRPVQAELVLATLPALPPIVADLVRVQWLAGMRPGEACALQPRDIDRTWKSSDGVPLWLVRFDGHKTAWRGHHRWVPLGPRAQEILAPYLERAPDAYCFCPREVAAAWAREHGRTFRPDQRRAPGERYDTERYDRVVLRACRRTFPPPEHLARRRAPRRGGWESVACWEERLGEDGRAELRAWEREHSWSPNQLRHARATEIETDCGREDARCVLGHRTPSTTAIYAESVERAARVMARMG